MWRRTLIVLVLVLIVAGIGRWLWGWSTPHAPADPWKAVPTNATYVLEIPAPLTTWQRFTSTAQLWDALTRMPVCAALGRLMEHVNDAAAGPLHQAMDAGPLLITAEAGSADNGPLLAWPLALDHGQLTALGTAMGIDAGTSSSLLAGNTIEWRPDTALPALHLAWREGLLLIGDRAGTVTDALTRSARTPATQDSLFLHARATLGAGSEAHLLLRTDRAARMLTSRLLPEALADAEMPSGWAALDVRLRPEAVLMSGLLFTDKGTKALGALAHQPEGRLTIARVLPARTCWLGSTRVDDPIRYVQDIAATAPDDSLFNAYAAWVRGNIGTALAGNAADSSLQRWAVLQAGEPGKAVEALDARCLRAGRDTSTYRGVRITRIPDSDALPQLFGPAFQAFGRPYWSLLGDKVVFAQSPAGMREAIDAWTDGSSLALDVRSGRSFQQYASDAVYTWWANGADAFPHLRALAKPEEAQGLDAWRPVWNTLGGCLVELSPEREGVYGLTASILHGAPAQQEVGALWSVTLGAPVEAGPFLLTDHLSRTLLVLAQDSDHRISLIGCTGKVLWQRELDGPILGEVRQVDRFKNGKLQMLFNTAGRVYLIDRNGKDVTGFPVVPANDAAAPLSVFDYDGNKDYRVLVPLIDGRLANYDMNGKVVQGWAFPDLGEPAVVPVEHLRIKTKDYLVAVGSDGHIAVIDRKGEARYTPQLVLKGLSGFLGMRTAMEIGECRLLWADSAGAVLSGTLDGTVNTLSAAATGLPAVFDVDGDGRDDVLRVRSDSLLVIGAKGPILAKVLAAPALGPPFPVHEPGRATMVGLVMPSIQQVVAYDGSGRLRAGLPLKGATVFRIGDLNLDDRPELVTATDDGHVVAYTLPLASP
ncbi:MAG: PQQ-binding-like beta-propeller repeat protein [Flavobacteriales bacterium]